MIIHHANGLVGLATASLNIIRSPLIRSLLLRPLQHDLRICLLPQYLLYDTPWPVRKVPLRATPHFVAFHPESKVYSVVAWRTKSCRCRRYCKLLW